MKYFRLFGFAGWLIDHLSRQAASKPPKDIAYNNTIILTAFQFTGITSDLAHLSSVSLQLSSSRKNRNIGWSDRKLDQFFFGENTTCLALAAKGFFLSEQHT